MLGARTDGRDVVAALAAGAATDCAMTNKGSAFVHANRVQGIEARMRDFPSSMPKTVGRRIVPATKLCPAPWNRVLAAMRHASCKRWPVAPIKHLMARAVPRHEDHGRQGDERQDQAGGQPRRTGLAPGRRCAAQLAKSALGAYFRRLCSRMDKPKAVTAAAHKLARLIYTMLTRGEEYTDQGQDYYEERYRERVLRALSQRAAKMGMQMVPIASVEQPQPA